MNYIYVATRRKAASHTRLDVGPTHALSYLKDSVTPSRDRLYRPCSNPRQYVFDAGSYVLSGLTSEPKLRNLSARAIRLMYIGGWCVRYSAPLLLKALIMSFTRRQTLSDERPHRRMAFWANRLRRGHCRNEGDTKSLWKLCENARSSSEPKSTASSDRPLRFPTKRVDLFDDFDGDP